MENNVRFDEISSSDDLTFSVMCAAVARKIAVMNQPLLYYRLGHSGTITSTMRYKLFNVKLALESVERQIKALPYAEKIKLALYYLIIENYCFIFQITLMILKHSRQRITTILFIEDFLTMSLVLLHLKTLVTCVSMSCMNQLKSILMRKCSNCAHVILQ